MKDLFSTLPFRTLPIFLSFVIALGSSKSQAIEEEDIFQLLAEARASARSGSYSEALEQLEEVMSLAQAMDEQFALAITLDNMAEIHHLQGDSSEALDRYTQALQIYQEIGHSMGARSTEEKVDKILGRTRKRKEEPKKPPEVAAIEIPSEPQETPAETPEMGSETRKKLIKNAIDRIRSRIKEQRAKKEAEAALKPEATGATAAIPRDPFFPQGGTKAPPVHTLRSEYLKKVKENIVRAWRYPEAASEGKEEGKVDVEFTIQKTGRLQGVRILKSSGFSSLDREAIRAVGAASPFNPIPRQLREDPLIVRFTFNYTLETDRASK